MNTALFSYFSDERDAAIASQSPVLIAPRFGSLPELEPGKHRYLVDRTGLFLEAKTHALSACIKLSESIHPLPFGLCKEYISLKGGLISNTIMKAVIKKAVAVSPLEYACLILYHPKDDTYSVHEPKIFNHGTGFIQYDNTRHDPLCVALDIHTHGVNDAFFSQQDDRDDLSGIHISTVLGECNKGKCAQAVSRLCIHGRFFTLPEPPFCYPNPLS